ncbi:MAG: hypothetical protein R3E66_24235 [bacterium]
MSTITTMITTMSTTTITTMSTIMATGITVTHTGILDTTTIRQT